jgi:hypothetical protein
MRRSEHWDGEDGLLKAIGENEHGYTREDENTVLFFFGGCTSACKSKRCFPWSRVETERDLTKLQE